MLLPAVLAFLFLLSGIFVLSGKSPASAARSIRYADPDQTALHRFLGKFLLVCALCALLWMLSAVLAAGWLLAAGLALLFASISFACIYRSAENNFDPH